MNKQESLKVSMNFVNMCQRILVASVVVLFLSGCTQPTNEEKQVQKATWVTEEVLQQLVELKAEMQGIKKQVVSLNQKLSQKPRLPKQKAIVELGTNAFMGDDSAEYAIVEFMDYQCPFCARFAKNTLPEIKEKLIDTGKVKFLIRDYPLEFHSEARSAAIATNCAGQQEHYWAMHDALVTNMSSIGNDLYFKIAKEIGLNLEGFESCLKDPKQNEIIDEHIAHGNKVGVSGTPKFYVGKIVDNHIENVIPLSGAQSYGAFAAAIAKLDKTGS
jgi:protein-disulfide isomerase